MPMTIRVPRAVVAGAGPSSPQGFSRSRRAGRTRFRVFARARDHARMVPDSTGMDALRATGWIVGIVAGLSGLLGPVLAGDSDPTSLVGVVSGSGACVLAA